MVEQEIPKQTLTFSPAERLARHRRVADILRARALGKMELQFDPLKATKEQESTFQQEATNHTRRFITPHQQKRSHGKCATGSEEIPRGESLHRIRRGDLLSTITSALCPNSWECWKVNPSDYGNAQLR
jgi:hypothetical protein